MEVKSKLNNTAAVFAALGAAGYLLRFINHFTYYVIKIKYAEAFLYGLIPCLLIAFFAVSLLLKKKPFALPGFSACGVTLFSLIVSLCTETRDGTDVASIVVIAVGFFFALLYLLTFFGVVKTKIPVCILSVISTFVYMSMLAVSIYVYTTSSDTVASYFGIIGSVAGLALFYIAVMLSAFSLKMKKKEENEINTSTV